MMFSICWATVTRPANLLERTSVRLATLPIILYAEDHPDDWRLHEVLSGTANEPQIRGLPVDPHSIWGNRQGHAGRAELQGRGAHHARWAYPPSAHRRALEEPSSSQWTASAKRGQCRLSCLSSSSTGTFVTCSRAPWSRFAVPGRPSRTSRSSSSTTPPGWLSRHGAIDVPWSSPYRQRAEPRLHRRQQPGHSRGNR